MENRIRKQVGGKKADGVPLAEKLAENEWKIGEILPKIAVLSKLESGFPTISTSKTLPALSEYFSTS